MPKQTNEHYAHHNDAYKKLIVLSHELGAPEPKEIFRLSGVEVSGSQSQGWRVGRDSRHFRIIREEQLLSFIKGLTLWVSSITIMDKSR